MKRLTRYGVLTCASAAALVVTGSAFAAYTSPKLEVRGQSVAVGTGGPVTVRLSTAEADDPTFKVTLYAPLGYNVALTQTVGSTVGTVNAEIVARALGGARVPVSGQITVADPATFATSTTAAACAGPPPYQAVWLLNLTVQGTGQSLQVPAFVNQVTTGAEASFASWKLQACLPSPDVPVEQGGAQLGAKLVHATLVINGVFTNPTSRGDYTWRTFMTPYVPGSRTVNPAGTVEARAIVRLPAQLIISARFNARLRVVTIRGTLTEAGTGIEGAAVQILAGRTATPTRRIRTVRTDEDGTFAFTIRATTGRTFYRARATLPGPPNSRDIKAAGCATPSTAPAGCVNATAAGYTVQSRGAARVQVPRPRRR